MHCEFLEAVYRHFSSPLDFFVQIYDFDAVPIDIFRYVVIVKVIVDSEKFTEVSEIRHVFMIALCFKYIKIGAVLMRVLYIKMFFY